MSWFRKKSVKSIDDIVYPVGTEVWGFFHPSFKTLGDSKRCREARFEKFIVAGSKATFLNGELNNVVYDTHFEDMRYDLTFIPLEGKYVDKDLNVLKERILDLAHFGDKNE